MRHRGAALVLLFGASALGASALGACAGGGDSPEPSSNTSGMPTSTGTGGSGGSGGTGGSATGGGGAAMGCDKLCDHIATIDCQAWGTCPADCAKKLGAPPECSDEFDALLACWNQHLADLTCSMLQILPPEACSAEEAAFHSCFAPDTSCICGAGVGNSGADKCARKTTCGSDEFSAICQQGSTGSWACSCYNGATLLGTCTEAMDVTPHCDNQIGCCVAYFCAP